MSAARFHLIYTEEAAKVLDSIQGSAQYVTKWKKIRKALRLLENPGPGHPGLHSHQYQSIPGPGGSPLWESYVENRTPSAWRIWWIYGPGRREITVVTLGPHP
ncbi:MAG: hypothetical protein ACRDPT_07645 [Streptomycetales bacterium]